MHNITYRIDFGGIVLTHGRRGTPMLRDGMEGPGADFNEYTEADALAVSGDYFMVLATRLDALSQRMAPDSPEHIEIEHMIQTLFYLHRRYTIVPHRKRRTSA